MATRDHREMRQELYRYFQTVFPDTSNPRDEVIRYVMLSPRGKLSRPLMLEQIAAAYDSSADLLPHATAVECVHRGSLMYDDLPAQDNCELRHGEPSCWKYFDDKWGKDRGVAATEMAANLLMGTKPIELVDSSNAGNEKKEKIRRQLVKVAKELSDGQFRDLGLGHGKRTTMNSETRMYYLKTGSLYVAAATIGGILGDASEKDLKHLGKFGRYLGIGYQYVDNYNDRYGTEAQLGKPVGQNAANGRAPLFCKLSRGQILHQVNRYRRLAHKEISALRKGKSKNMKAKFEVLREIVDKVVSIPA